MAFDIRTARKHRPGADYNDRGLPRAAVIFLLTEELCVASLPLLRKKADDDTQATDIAAPTSDTGVNAWG
jgi:hypothetical protein